MKNLRDLLINHFNYDDTFKILSLMEQNAIAEGVEYLRISKDEQGNKFMFVGGA